MWAGWLEPSQETELTTILRPFKSLYSFRTAGRWSTNATSIFLSQFKVQAFSLVGTMSCFTLTRWFCMLRLCRTSVLWAEYESGHVLKRRTPSVFSYFSPLCFISNLEKVLPGVLQLSSLPSWLASSSSTLVSAVWLGLLMVTKSVVLDTTFKCLISQRFPSASMRSGYPGSEGVINRPCVFDYSRCGMLRAVVNAHQSVRYLV